MYKLVSNQTLMYIFKLIHSVNHSESKIKYNYRLFSMILDYEIGFKDCKFFICFYFLSN